LTLQVPPLQHVGGLNAGQPQAMPPAGDLARSAMYCARAVSLIAANMALLAHPPPQANAHAGSVPRAQGGNAHTRQVFPTATAMQSPSVVHDWS
jgi:hypothetical protein